MEMEVMEARLIRASELNGEMDDDDTGKSTFFETYTLFKNKLMNFHITQNIFFVPLSCDAIHIYPYLKWLY